MIRPVSLYIGLRYTRAKRRNHFISFISLASMLGIALGVMVLITVLSVMNGFNYQIRTKFFAVAPQVTILTNENITHTWQQQAKRLLSLPQVKSLAPYVSGKGMLISHGQVEGVQAVGIIPMEEEKISSIGKYTIEGSLSSLKPGKFNIVVGQTLATNLGLFVGDKVNLFTPQVNVTLAGSFLRYRQMTVSGIFHTKGDFGFDSSVAYINFEDAYKLFPTGQGVSGYYLKLKNLYEAPEVSEQLQTMFPRHYTVTDWTKQFGAFFQALTMQKTILFVILLLIVAIAAFNLVSTLVMVVNDKRADIAILRTLGATPGMIMRTFIIQGIVIGFIGTLLGLITGLLLAANVTALTNWVQSYFHIQLISSSVYFVDFLPSRIESSDVILVCTLSLFLSFLATIYPSWIAFRTQPAEALRYE